MAPARAASKLIGAGCCSAPAEAAALTPDAIIKLMLEGSARFDAGTPRLNNSLAEMKAMAGGQFPAAVVVSCVDSRAIVEVLCGLAIGGTFNARVAATRVALVSMTISSI